MNKFCWALVGMIVVGAVARVDAQEQLSAESKQKLRELQVAIVNTISSIQDIERQNGNNTQLSGQLLAVAPSSISNLGLILDVSNSSDFYPVLAVTPDSAAAKAGLKAGDKVYSVNGVQARPDNAKAVFNAISSGQPAQKVVLDVEKDRKRQTISVLVGLSQIPGFTLSVTDGKTVEGQHDASLSTAEQCAEVSWLADKTIDRTFYPVNLKRINGETYNSPNNINRAALTNMETGNMTHLFRSKVRLKPGSYVLTFNSPIAADELNNNRPQMRKVLYAKKDFTLDVKANMSYVLAAILEDQAWQITLLRSKEATCEVPWFEK